MAKAEKTGQTRDLIAQPPSQETIDVIARVIEFLRLFMSETLAKRIISMVLIALAMPDKHVTELTGLCDRSVRALRKAIGDGDIGNLFSVGGGRGPKRKLASVEEEIIKEIDGSNYHTRQEIADMIQEKYGIKVSLPAVGRLLKKIASNA